MKKIRAAHLCLLAAAMLLTACGSGHRRQEDKSREADGSFRLQVVTTLFPYYDFTRQIAGDQVDLTLVIPAGMDSHSFEPTPADMRTIQNADVLICNGGEMEHWLRDVLGAMDTSHMTIVTMMDYVDTREEELVEGMEDVEHDHGDEDDHNHEAETDGHEMEIEYDEHIWTSPVNAMKLTAAIGEALEQRDPEHASSYRNRAADYKKQLEQIDAGLREVSENRVRDMIIVGDKFPFRYLADEYGIEYRAAFSGCSGDTEPSASTIAYLIDKIRTEKIPVVYYLELSSHRVAEIIGEETGAQPLLLHSCHNVTRAQLDSGVTYVELMKHNIENLRKGLDE